MSQSKINVYTCPYGHKTVTVDLDEGVTPFLITCKQHHEDGQKCTAVANSNFYRVQADLKPEFEWYKPFNLKGLSKAEKQHVKDGGLAFNR